MTSSSSANAEVVTDADVASAIAAATTRTAECQQSRVYAMSNLHGGE